MAVLTLLGEAGSLIKKLLKDVVMVLNASTKPSDTSANHANWYGMIEIFHCKRPIRRAAPRACTLRAGEAFVPTHRKA